MCIYVYKSVPTHIYYVYICVYIYRERDTYTHTYAYTCNEGVAPGPEWVLLLPGLGGPDHFNFTKWCQELVLVVCCSCAPILQTTKIRYFFTNSGLRRSSGDSLKKREVIKHMKSRVFSDYLSAVAEREAGTHLFLISAAGFFLIIMILAAAASLDSLDFYFPIIIRRCFQYLGEVPDCAWFCR